MLNFSWGRLGGLAIAVLLVLGGLPAFAAKPVTTTVPQKPSERTYEEAAQVLGAKFWGDRFGARQLNHVTLRLGRSETSLAITVPAWMPPAAASTRLQDLADRLGWSDARLYQWVESGTQVFVLRRQTAQELRWVGWARSRAVLNVSVISEWIRTLNTAPSVVAVRTLSPDLADTTPAANVRGTHRGESFLFFTEPAAPLQVYFQLPARLSAAFVGALLLWMFFPVVAALGLRHYAAKQLRLVPEAQTERFERWRHPLTWITVGGMFISLGALGRDRLDLIVPGLSFNLTPIVLVPLWFWAGAAAGWGWARGGGRRAPLPPGDRTARVFMLIASLAVGLAFMALSGNGGGGPSPQTIGLVVGGLLILCGLGVLVTPLPSAVKQLEEARSRVPAIGDDPESLRSALAMAAARAAAQAQVPIPPLSDKLDPGIAAQIRSFGEAARGLEPDQQAALEVAAQLKAAGITRRPAGAFFTVRLPISGILLAGGLLVAAIPPTTPAGVMTLGGVAVILIFGVRLLGPVPQRQAERTEHEADLKVARAMEEPQRLVEALRRLEEATESLGAEAGFSLSSSFARRRRNLERLLAFAVLCLGLGSARPGLAASPEPSPEPPDLGRYQEAARAIGAEFWGDPTQPSQTAHAVLRVGAYRTSLTLVVPGPLPEARLAAWLEENARELGWTDADLQFYAGAERCFLGLGAPTRRRARTTGLSRRLELDLPRLTTQLKTLSPGPVVLAIRSNSPDLDFQVTPAAGKVIRGDYGDETYLFYAPAALPTTPLLLDYRLPTRWLIAVTATLLLWVLLPLGAALALRHHLVQAMGDRPAELARTYASRASFVRLVAVAGSFGTLWLLGMGRLDFLYPGLGTVWPFLLVIPVWSAAALGCRAMRPAVPEAQVLGRRQDLGLMVLRHLALLAIGPGSVLLFLFAPNWRGGGFSRGVWLPGLALTTFSLYLLVNVALQNFRAARIPQSPELPQVDGSPESIRTALAEATQFLEANPRHVIPLPKELKGTAVEQRFLRLQEKVLELDADQRAALRASQAVVLRDARVKNPWVHRVVLLSLVILGAGGIALMVGRHTPGSAMGVTLGSVFTFALLQRLVRRKLLRPVISAQADADLLVAREMEQPERLLAALRALEEFAAHDPVLSDPRLRIEEFAHRREHLEEALSRGFDSPR